jgi:hypothetical protein
MATWTARAAAKSNRALRRVHSLERQIVVAELKVGDILQGLLSRMQRTSWQSRSSLAILLPLSCCRGCRYVQVVAPQREPTNPRD